MGVPAQILRVAVDGLLASSAQRIGTVGNVGRAGMAGRMVIDDRQYRQWTQEVDHRLLPVVRDRALARLSGGFAAEAKALAPKDRGRLAQGISERIVPGAGEAVVVSRLGYTDAVIDGSRPHAAPWRPIALWAKRHGLPPFPVWLKIKEQGTPAHDFVTLPFEHMLARSPVVIREELARAGVTHAG